MRKYLYLLAVSLLIPAIYVYATDGVSGVEHPAKVNSVATPDKVCGVSGLAASGGTYTMGSQNQPANVANTTAGDYTYFFAESCPTAGYISKIEVYINDADPNGFQFSVLSRSSNDFTDEHWKEDFTVSGGLNTWIEGTDYTTNQFPISVGEYFGWYQPANANMDKDDAAGYKGYGYDQGDQIGDGGSSTFDVGMEASGKESQIRITIRY